MWLIRRTLLVLLLFGFIQVKSQRIGVVLSGGGASGLCHIGMLKALEENHVPIDYICGTSIGALVSGYYAAGYSPLEIESLVKTYQFQNITRGDLPVQYEYLIKKREDYAAWLSLKYNFNQSYMRNLPTNVVNSVPIDYYLMETFSGPNVQSNFNFDSLFVPFRCVASDVEIKQPVVFKNGDLPIAIRASMSYPFYIKPIIIDNHLMFDGGLYNNFPTDVMIQSFRPDYLIGCNVSEKAFKPDDDNLYQQLRTMLTSQTDPMVIKDSSFIIEPWSDSGVFNFDNAQRLIDSGYAATMRQMPQILAKIKVRSNPITLAKKREPFKKTWSGKSLKIEGIEISGVNNKQAYFIKKSLLYNKESISIDELRKRYFRLVSDDKIKSIFPSIRFDSLQNRYILSLDCKQEKPFYLEPGAIISNRPISEGFLGLQYNYLGKLGFSAYANAYAGKLYSGTLGKIRMDIPGRIPMFIEPSYSYSRWDFYSSSALFFDFVKPAYLVQQDQMGSLKIGIPVGNMSRLSTQAVVSQWSNYYYKTDVFTKLDTADESYFDCRYIQTDYDFNTLNRKMYATEGTLLNARVRYVECSESYVPGNTSKDTVAFKSQELPPWLLLKFTLDTYVKTSKKIKLGFFGEAVFSTQNFFHNYESTILSAPVFNPTPESQTFFMGAYRAHRYLAGGFKIISSPTRAFDLRFEAYIFQPIHVILKNNEGLAEYAQPFLYRRISGLATAVYNSPIGPISFGINYYDPDQQKTITNNYSFFFHIGYIIFNKRSFE